MSDALDAHGGGWKWNGTGYEYGEYIDPAADWNGTHTDIHLDDSYIAPAPRSLLRRVIW